MFGSRNDRHREHGFSKSASGFAVDSTLDELDTFELEVLKIARYFFQSFARPESHAWLEAFRQAERVFPAPFGATIAHAVVIAIDAFRTSRRRFFQFDRPNSPFGKHTLTDCERYFIMTLHHIRRRDWISARAQALYLCEGNDTSATLAAFERLAIITGDVTDLHFNRPAGSAEQTSAADILAFRS